MANPPLWVCATTTQVNNSSIIRMSSHENLSSVSQDSTKNKQASGHMVSPMQATKSTMPSGPAPNQVFSSSPSRQIKTTALTLIPNAENPVFQADHKEENVQSTCVIENRRRRRRNQRGRNGSRGPSGASHRDSSATSGIPVATTRSRSVTSIPERRSALRSSRSRSRGRRNSRSGSRGRPTSGHTELTCADPVRGKHQQQQQQDASSMKQYGAAATAASAEAKPAWTRRYLCLFAKLAAAALYHVYLAVGVRMRWASAPDYCHDVKFLVVLTGVVYLIGLGYAAAALVERLDSSKTNSLTRSIRHCIYDTVERHRWLRPLLWLSLWTCLLVALVYDAMEDSYRLTSLSGIALLLFLGFVFSKYPTKVDWSQVMCGMLIQFLLGLCALRWDRGRHVLQCAADKIKHFLDYTNKGSFFVFGHLSSGWNLTEAIGDLAMLAVPQTSGANDTNGTTATRAAITSLFPVFMFQALPVIFFLSFFVNILYFYGIMQRLVLVIGKFLQLTIGTTACESMSAAANIFLGMTEAPLVIRPFLPKMTESEIHTIMTTGFATIAGSVMAAYISFGVSAGHLVTASIMSAPAALVYSKLLYPETEESRTHVRNIVMPHCEERNVLEAASNGATMGLTVIGNLIANLVAFLAFIAFLNGTLLWFSSIVAMDFLTFEWILAKLFTPLALAMGVSWKDSGMVGELIGIKTFANEFIAYSQLGTIIDQLDGA
ncbi:sodium/nucleoside cotransporter 1-like isoform X2 [Dermacentor albipictus]|uniref:sodium/nucleoside cotransporter 1-like isoform X2 n=1 Tax=Dermacentor albipictus TaxID=60249 RepID=UPI0038FCEBD8